MGEGGRAGEGGEALRGPAVPLLREAFAWVLAGIVLGLPFLFDALEAFAVLSPVPWLLLARRGSSRPILLAWLGGIAFLFTGLSWLHVVSPIAVLLAALYFGAYEGLSALVAGPLGRKLPCWVVAPLGIATTEALAQHVTLFDVTWLFHGHLAWRCPELLQVAEWGGISLLSAMLWFVAGSSVHLWEGRQRRWEPRTWAPLAASLLVLGGAWLAGAARIASLDLQEGPRVALLQGNVQMAIKLSPDAVGAMIRGHLSMTSELEGERLDLVVWPETAAMLPLEAHPEVVAAVAAVSRQVGAPVLLGAFGLNPTASPPAPSNSAFLVATEPRLLARQDKRILVPGAETLPVIRLIPPLRDAIGSLLSRTMGFRPNMVAGREAVVMRAGALKLGALICYGDLVPVPAEGLRGGRPGRDRGHGHDPGPVGLAAGLDIVVLEGAGGVQDGLRAAGGAALPGGRTVIGQRKHGKARTGVSGRLGQVAEGARTLVQGVGHRSSSSSKESSSQLSSSSSRSLHSSSSSSRSRSSSRSSSSLALQSSSSFQSSSSLARERVTPRTGSRSGVSGRFSLPA